MPLNGPNESYVAWVYTTGTATGSRTLEVPPSVPAGTYGLRLFANNTYTRLAVSSVVTIHP